MTGVPTIPPLLCNTPPPIDFGEEDDDSGLPPTLGDDDDFGDFALAADINDDGTNADVSSLPRTPLQFELSSSTTTSGYTDVPAKFEDCGTASISPLPPLQSTFSNTSLPEEDKYETKLNETCKNNIAKAAYAEENQSQSHEAVEEEITSIIGAQMQKVLDDNKQSTIDSNDAKFTNISCTTESQTSSPMDEKNDNICNAASGQEFNVSLNNKSGISPSHFVANVLLEDLEEDSSDEECHRSPKKSIASPTSQNSHKDDRDCEDFFAIHLVDSKSSSDSKKYTPKSISEDINMNTVFKHNNNIVDYLKDKKGANLNSATKQDDFGDFADFASASELIEAATTTVGANETVVDVVVSNDYVEKDDGDHADNETSAKDDDDFDDFQDFCTAPSVEAASDPLTDNALIVTKKNIKTIECKQVAEESVTNIEKELHPNNDIDDDFGDFEVASYDAPTPEVALPSTTFFTPVSTVTSGNISDRLGSVLKQMFPTTDDQSAGNMYVECKKETKLLNTLSGLESADTTLHFEAIETAKALEFQWPQSEIRHALIRSIGIDSRNILFGENWNPSMPRFAANLSFNPLKPMKPQSANTTNQILTSNNGGATDSMQYSTNSSTCATNMEISSYSTKTDVPDVDFDWQGDGLVNPLDGVKGEANPGATETIHPTPPVARFNTPDDQHQSHTTFTNVDDHISETLDHKNIEVMAAPPAAVFHTPLPLDMTTQHFGIQDSNMTSNNSYNSSVSNNKMYDNSKILTKLRLGANMADIEQDDVDDDDDDDDETVVTSTYAGPLKETHIYTPSKTEIATAKSNKSAPINSEPIDFDYEIAAAGIIIDEKVVKKEYRDVEYNPGFSLEVVNEYAEELPGGTTTILTNELNVRTALPTILNQAQTQSSTAEFDNDDFTEFTEFQSVPPTQLSTTAAASFAATTNSPSTNTSAIPVAPTTSKTINNSIQPVLPAAVTKTKECSNTPSRTNSPSIIDNMILSPAILLPQSIPIGGKNKVVTPAIEWGESTANIDPDELARIEELFPQPKMKAANLTQKASPTHTNSEKKATQIATTTISATVAMKEQDSTLNDDYWSEFVSVPAKPQLSNLANKFNNNIGNISSNNNNNNNQLAITANNALRSPRQHQQQQQQQQKVQRTLTPTPQKKSNATVNAMVPSARVSATSTYNNSSNSNSNINNSNSNDDDWSDFVSNTPAQASTATTTSFTPAAHAPQFNSAAWQNASFYNNPLGLYHQHAVNIHTRNSAMLTPQQQQLQLQQQIHIMQDFSTAPTTTATRPHANLHNTNSNMAHINNMQHSFNTYSPLQVGNARVAPSISLIPDLGFVAPALPVHTAFVNVLPKTSFNSNKK